MALKVGSNPHFHTKISSKSNQIRMWGALPKLKNDMKIQFHPLEVETIRCSIEFVIFKKHLFKPLNVVC